MGLKYHLNIIEEVCYNNKMMKKLLLTTISLSCVLCISLQEVYDNSSINAYIRRTYDDGRPERWSQLPQTFLSLDDSSASYLSFGVGFIRISLQSEGSIQELFEMMKGNDLKLVIN